MSCLAATRELNNACYCGHAEVALDALSRGADPLLSGSSGKCALHFAAMGGHAELCARLCALFPEAMRLRDDSGMTALHLSCRGGKTDAAIALRRAGSDPMARDEFGRTPSDCADDQTRKRLGDIERELLASSWALRALAQALSSTRTGNAP
jgi:ankyrin repeat protein